MFRKFILVLFLFAHDTFALHCKSGSAQCSAPGNCVDVEYSDEYCGVHLLSDNYCTYTRPSPSCSDDPCDMSTKSCISFMGCWSDSSALKDFCEDNGNGCYWSILGRINSWVSIRVYENSSVDFLFKKFRPVVVAVTTVITA